MLPMSVPILALLSAMSMIAVFAASIAAVSLFQGRAEADGLFRIAVRGYSGLCRRLRVFLRTGSRFAVNRVKAAETLFKIAACGHRVFDDLADPGSNQDFLDAADHPGADAFPGALARSAPIDKTFDIFLYSRRFRYDVYISVT